MNQTSLIEPLQKAYERMKLLLFAPFDLGQWCTLGFSAWLATLEEFAGSTISFGDFSDYMAKGGMTEIKAMLIAALTVVVVLIALISFAFFIVILWIDARGKFIFLDNLVRRHTLIVEPWKKFKRLGNSFFVWNICLMFVILLVFVAILVAGILMVIPAFMSNNMSSVAVTLLILTPFIVLFIIVLLYVYLFLRHFVLLIMYKHHEKTTEAWRRFLPLFKKNAPIFLLYGLFCSLLSFVLGIAILVFAFMTCCCGLLILAIPYIGTVALLPFYVFLRYFSIEFLKQFGPDFDVDATPQPPPLMN